MPLTREELFKTLNLVNQPIFVFDAYSQILQFCNSAGARWWNPSSDANVISDLSGKHLSYFIPTEHHRGHDAHVKKFLTQQRGGDHLMGKMRTNPYFPMVTPRGNVPVTINLSTIMLNEGNEHLIIANITDLSLQHELTQQQEKLAEKQTRLIKFQQSISYNLTHEINTPLQQVLYVLALLKERANSQFDKTEIQRVEDILDRQASILNLAANSFEDSSLSIPITPPPITIQNFCSFIVESVSLRNGQVIFTEFYDVDISSTYMIDVNILDGIIKNILLNISVLLPEEDLLFDIYGKPRAIA
jgi:hypothetical protein